MSEVRSGPPGKTRPRSDGFDQASRDRIRRVLLRYMEQHGIGVPKLRERIAVANGFDPIDIVDQKTLQRFLADSHRTRDEFVGYCQAFTEMNSDDAPLEEFGEAIVAFLGVRLTDGGTFRPIPAEWTGTFRGRARRAPDAGTNLRLSLGEADDWVSFSEIVIEVPPHRLFAIVRETVHNWTRRPPVPSETGGETIPRRVYEGVALYPNGTLFAVMRSILSGAPRTYWLAGAGSGRLGGKGDEARTRLNGGDRLVLGDDVLFDPVEAQSR